MAWARDIGHICSAPTIWPKEFFIAVTFFPNRIILPPWILQDEVLVVMRNCVLKEAINAS
jgi:hypothetical protein